MEDFEEELSGEGVITLDIVRHTGFIEGPGSVIIAIGESIDDQLEELDSQVIIFIEVGFAAFFEEEVRIIELFWGELDILGRGAMDEEDLEDEECGDHF